MLNKTRKLITGTVLSLSAAVLLLLFSSTQVGAAGNDSDTVADLANDATLAAGTAAAGKRLAAGIDDVVLDSAAGVIILGAVNTTDAFTIIDNTNGALAIAITASSNAGTHLVTIAGDIDLAAADDQLTINVTNTNTLWQGDIGTDAGTDPTLDPDIIIGGGSGAGKTLTATFDTAHASNLANWAEVLAKHADDTITMAVTNSDTTSGNAIVFKAPIGGTTVNTALDALTLGAVTTTTFASTVRADLITNSSALVTTFSGAVTGALAFAADGTAAFAAGKGVTGAITNTTGADGKGTLTIVGTTDVAFGGQIGASGASLKAANITITDADADAATFAGKVYALAIGITGNADDTDFVDFADDVVGTITITTGGTVELAANKTITGDFKSAANSVGELNVLAATTVGTTAIVTGNVGIDAGHKIEELDVITGATATVIQSITGKVDAVAVNVTGTGTLAFGGAVDATNVNAGTVSFLTFAEDLTGILNLNVAATGTFAPNKKVVGSVDTSGTAGILTFEATTATTTYVDGTVGTTGALDAINVAPAVVSGTAIVGTFGNTVAATLLTHSGAGTVAFAAATAIPTINLTGDGKISFASGIGHTGAITTGTTNTGSIDFVAGNQAVSGTVGASGALIKQITQVGGSGTLTFNDDVFATQLTINSTGGVTMGTADDLNANVYFDADGTLTLHTDGMTGDVTTQTGNTGTVVAGQNMTITGNLGTSDLILKMVDVGAAVAITGTVYATEVDIAAVALSMSADADIIGAVDFSADGTLNLADGADVTGTIIPSAGNHGTVNVAGTSTISGVVGNVGSHDLLLLAVGAAGKLTLGGGFEGTQITVASGGVLNYTSATTAHTGNLVVTGTGTVNVGTTTTTVSGTLTMPATSTFKVTIGDTNGKLIHSTAAPAFNATNGLLEPVIAGRITSGTAITVFAGAAVPNLPSVTDNYERYSFLLAPCNTNDLCLTPTLVTPTGVSANSAAVSAIADIAFASDSTLSTALNTLSGASLDKALETLAPAVSGGAIAGAVSAGGAAGATISTQMASLRSGIAAGQGLNAGDGTATEERFWTQAFGTYGEQNVRQKIAGFTTTTGGAALGVDKRLGDDLVLGLAYSFSHTNINGSESKNKTKVTGHQATLYGSHDFDRGLFNTDGVFLDGQLSYAYNDYDGERYIEVGAVSRRADSAYDGLQISSSFNLGKTFKLDDGFRFTPTAGFSYSHVSIDSYDETNAGASNLKLQDQDYVMFGLNLKGKIAGTWQVEGIDMTPEVHLGYSYETIHDKIQTVSTFQGGGNAFTSTGFSPANSTYLGGIGVTWGGDSQPVDMTVTYDATHKEDFLSHSALVKGVWRF